MKLHWSPKSPYVQKVMVVLHEVGLVSEVELVRSVVAMTKPNVDVMVDNPLNKIPTLLTDDGVAIFDSRVICEYLDGLHNGHKLFPEDNIERMRVLRWQAIADGLLDIMILWRNELMRPTDIRSKPHLEAFKFKRDKTLSRLEDELAEINEAPISIGTITIACALSYSDFRFKDNWRGKYTALAKWYDNMSQRPSFVVNMPEDDG